MTSKHPRARVLACATEAAALQGRFWEMHDSLLEDQAHLDQPHLWERARTLGLDLERFDRDRRSAEVAERVERDFRSGVRAGVVTTPTQFVDGVAHPGIPDRALIARLDSINDRVHQSRVSPAVSGDGRRSIRSGRKRASCAWSSGVWSCHALERSDSRARPAPPACSRARSRRQAPWTAAARRAASRRGRGTSRRRSRCPAPGAVTARLDAAGGDWDLAVFEADTGQVVAGSAYRGSREVAAGYAVAGERLVVQACRLSGSVATASLSVDSTAISTSGVQTSKLVRVSTPDAARAATSWRRSDST